MQDLPTPRLWQTSMRFKMNDVKCQMSNVKCEMLDLELDVMEPLTVDC